MASEVQVADQQLWKYIAVGNESGAHVDIQGAELILNMNGDRVVVDEHGDTIGIFPPDYAVIRSEEEESDV